MKRILFIVSLFLCSGFISDAYADSPLTSVDLSRIYSDDPHVQHALKIKKMDKQTIDFLLDCDAPLELRMVVVNALGWHFPNTTKRSDRLLKAILKKYKLSNLYPMYDDPKYASILCIYTYALAMDSYLNVAKALFLRDIILELKPDDPTIQYVSSMVLAQDYFLEKDWCSVYRCFDDVRNKSYFQTGTGKGILQLTFDYVGAYQKYCSALLNGV